MIKILKQTLVTQFVDEETGEIIEDKREFKDDSIKTSKSSSSSSRKKSKNPYDEDPEPILVREDNKLVLNVAAVEMLGASEGERINIKEQAVNRKKRLIIGLSETFGTKEGNLLTKSNTIRWSGKNADMVARYGDEFNFEPYKDGLFVLVNRNEEESEQSSNPDEETIDIAQELEELNANLEDETELLDDDLNFQF